MLFGHPRIGVPELRRNDTHRHTLRPPAARYIMSTSTTTSRGLLARLSQAGIASDPSAARGHSVA